MTTTKRAARVIDAWDSTVLPVANDGRLQEAMEDLRAALAEQAAEQAEPVAVPAGLYRSDAEFWLRHRAAIIDACRAEGYTIVTTAQGARLMRLGKVEAQAAPAEGEKQ